MCLCIKCVSFRLSLYLSLSFVWWISFSKLLTKIEMEIIFEFRFETSSFGGYCCCCLVSVYASMHHSRGSFTRIYHTQSFDRLDIICVHFVRKLNACTNRQLIFCLSVTFSSTKMQANALRQPTHWALLIVVVVSYSDVVCAVQPVCATMKEIWAWPHSPVFFLLLLH